MKITGKHYEAARRLVERRVTGGFGPQTVGQELRAPSHAERGYLAAVERIVEAPQRGDRLDPLFCARRGVAFTTAGRINVEGLWWSVEHVRERAYDLLVLADIAEAAAAPQAIDSDEPERE